MRLDRNGILVLLLTPSPCAPGQAHLLRTQPAYQVMESHPSPRLAMRVCGGSPGPGLDASSRGSFYYYSILGPSRGAFHRLETKCLLSEYVS